MTLQSLLARSLVAKSTWKLTFWSTFWRATFGQRNASSSANTYGSQVSFAESSSAPHFTQNMPLSAIFAKVELSKKFSFGHPFAKMLKMTNFSCLGI